MSEEIEKTVASVLYLDEAGDPTLFAKGGKVVADTEGCSRFFILGKLEVMDAAALETDLVALRADILADPYFKGVPSFEPRRNKTAIAFHAKNDLAEVRYRVFQVLRRHELRFYAVVRDKLRLLDYVQQRNRIEPGYRYDPTGNELYDEFTRELFGRVHRLGHSAKVIFAQCGSKPRLQAFRDAVRHAEESFAKDFDLKRGVVTDIDASLPKKLCRLASCRLFPVGASAILRARRREICAVDLAADIDGLRSGCRALRARAQRRYQTRRDLQ